MTNEKVRLMEDLLRYIEKGSYNDCTAAYR